MPAYADIYVLSSDRTVACAVRFLDRFLPRRAQTADEFEIPQYAETPDVVHPNALPVMERCCREHSLPYNLYWRALDGRKPGYAMILYLVDGTVVYGLSTEEDDGALALRLLQEIQAFLSSSEGFIGHEATPSFDTAEQFRRIMAEES